MALKEYKQKRKFSLTPEPAGKTVKKGGWSYVIQKHDASHLHYDFRLELDGVLKSWAVPKGPSLDPSVKRLAVEVEDHPVAYGDFEGTIPEGEYGGGTVLLWDHGSWEPLGDVYEDYKQGKLKFILHGDKLRGKWMLLRTRRPGTSSKPQWLLVKEKDDEAVAADEFDILDEKPLSVQSGRSLEEIAKNPRKGWSSKSKKPIEDPHDIKTIPTAKTKSDKKAARESDRKIEVKGRKAPLPKAIDVELATLTAEPPTGDQWLHEFKLDGYRMVCRIDGKKITMMSRNHQDWSDRLQPIVAAARKLEAQQAILDGEVVALLPDGTTDFQALQNAFHDSRPQELKYYVFDLLYLDGEDLRQLPLLERKQALESLLRQSDTSGIFQFSEHIQGSGKQCVQQACRLHLEGIISKRTDQPYQAGRSYQWLKIKCLHEDEFVIGGYTDPSGSRTGLGALLVGFHDDKGHLKYAGKVGTGFDTASLASLSKQLKAIEQTKSPFSNLTQKTGDGRNAHWTKPVLVGQIKYGSLTRDDRLRHASFQGLREDLPAKDVTLRQPISISQAEKQSKKTATKSKGTVTPTTRSTKSANSSAPTEETIRGVRLTHPDKIFYPDSGITKKELAAYYDAVAEWILPYLKDRPLVAVRCPEGEGKACFYQKHPGAGTPSNLKQVTIEEKSGTGQYLVIDTPEGLVSLAQLGALELHVWGARVDNLERPDRLTFDLDPAPDVEWKNVVHSAHQIREFLSELGLKSFVKTTGGKGVHIVVPTERRHDWDVVKSFCKRVSELIVQAAPAQFTSNMSKSARSKKIFLDYLRNQRGSTAVAAYSTRARPRATVSTPISWDELTPRLKSDEFTIRDIPNRLKSLRKDPWKELIATKQSLSGAIKKLASISEDS